MQKLHRGALAIVTAILSFPVYLMFLWAGFPMLYDGKHTLIFGKCNHYSWIDACRSPNDVTCRVLEAGEGF